MKKAKKHLNNTREPHYYFPTPKEIIEKAYSDSGKVNSKRKGKEIVKKKAVAQQRVKVFGRSSQKKISELSKYFPQIDEMNPFYRDLLGLITDVNRIKQNLSALNSAAKIIKSLTSQYGGRIFKAESVEGVISIQKSFEGRVCSVIRKLEKPLKQLKEDSKKLKELPSIDFESPTIVLTGYPNVGKTTLLKRLTGASARISPYQFTTKQINSGFFEVNYRKVQVLDTPGLLDRKNLNNIEKKALAAVKHLANIIVFVVDPTLACGYDLEEQVRLFEHIESEFEGKRILVVVNKVDSASKNELEAAEKEFGDAIIEGEGFDNLGSELEKVILN